MPLNEHSGRAQSLPAGQLGWATSQLTLGSTETTWLIVGQQSQPVWIRPVQFPGSCVDPLSTLRQAFTNADELVYMPALSAVLTDWAQQQSAAAPVSPQQLSVRYPLPLSNDFYTSVWQELMQVPAGQTISYGQLAKRAGSPRAAQAVGNAMAANPLPLLIPCHRVILSSGHLGNYMWGSELKQLLLDWENGLRP